jgi:hypothetical protein
VCLIVQKLPLKMIGAARRLNWLYYLQQPSNTDSSSVIDSSFSFSNPSAAVKSVSYQLCNTSINQSCLWHIKLGHVSNKILKEICKQYPDIKFHDLSDCDICHLARQKRLSYPISNTKSSSFFQLIHIDIWGPIGTSSFEGYKYFLTIVDDYSRYTWIHP